ncbi:hypothetical protein TNCV_1456131 [Trichonephila clavipes]|nr:hypothetical protein TNCV_1456131 [Trichonephila clavipes]
MPPTSLIRHWLRHSKEMLVQKEVRNHGNRKESTIPGIVSVYFLQNLEHLRGFLEQKAEFDVLALSTMQVTVRFCSVPPQF